MSNRSSFTGKIGFVLAAAGSAVGLGNIWRFPYLAAKYGGGIFLLIYFLLLFTFGYALIMAETSLGRNTRLSPVGAYRTFADKQHSFLKIGGWLNAIVPMIILPYYCLIGGWVIKYMFEYLTGGSASAAADGFFVGFITSNFVPVVWHLLFLGCTAAIILMGVQKGVEYAILTDSNDEDTADADAEDEGIACYVMKIVATTDESGEELEEFVPVEDQALEAKLMEIASMKLNSDEEADDED